jgi:hypothetical protein
MNPETGLNCGVCEKCIRTMLELLAIDKLAGAESFPVQHIDIDLLDTIKLRTDYQVTMYEELMVPLAAAGYDKIVERLQAKLDAYEKRLAWEEERDWKGAVKRFDRKWLNSSLYKVYAAVRPRVVDRLL